MPFHMRRACWAKGPANVYDVAVKSCETQIDIVGTKNQADVQQLGDQAREDVRSLAMRKMEELASDAHAPRGLFAPSKREWDALKCPGFYGVFCWLLPRSLSFLE